MLRSLFAVCLCFVFSFSEVKAEEELKYRKDKIKIGSKIVSVELADQEDLREHGLMYREKLGEDEGMLFIFENQRPLSFWMKNTRLPLDIGYFDANKKLTDILAMEPEPEMVREYKTYPSSGPAQFALEMNKGWFKKNKISKGAIFSFLKKK